MAHLFIIAGHGAGDSGAVGNGYTEAERVRALASRLAALGGSGVTVGDTSRNWYRDNGISHLSIPKDWQILELHMDSASASARGGHVIIKSGFAPDAYDNALAGLIGGMFPGRSKLIVGRSGLANVNQAAKKGYGYRLMECGFISNPGDVQTFNSRMDEFARGILSAFGIGCVQKAPGAFLFLFLFLFRCSACYIVLWLPLSASVMPFTEEEYSDGDIPVAALNCLEK